MSKGHCKSRARGMVCGRGDQPDEVNVLLDISLWPILHQPGYLSDDELLPDAECLGDDVTHGVTQEVDVLSLPGTRGHWHPVKKYLALKSWDIVVSILTNRVFPTPWKLLNFLNESRGHLF